MNEEKLTTFAPGRLSALLSLGLRGYHPLFEREAILAAFELPDAPVAREDAHEVGQVLLTICSEPLTIARGAVKTLSDPARVALIRLYFRLLDRAERRRRSVQ